VKAGKGPTAAEKRRVERLAGELETLEQAYADSAQAGRAEMENLEVQAAKEKARFDQTRTKLIRNLAEAREKL